VSHHCYECEVLKEFYWLKVNQFLLATRPASAQGPGGGSFTDEEMQALKDDAMEALSALISHWKSCYGLAEVSPPEQAAA
jgi:hypothetical protein